MFSLLYDLVLLLLALLALPRWLFLRCVHGKYRSSLSSRLGVRLPPACSQQQVIWIHAVSVGETRAVLPLFSLLKQQHPESAIVISSTTETGQAEAKRCMPDAAGYFFLPFDISWSVRRVVARVRPNLLILVEGDFWYHLMREVKRVGGDVLLVNGKISEKSAHRFQRVPFFTKRLFSFCDHLCVQSERFVTRFASLGIPPSRITATGNLKWEMVLPPRNETLLQAWKQELGISSTDPVIVIGSTHAPEEEEILAALEPLLKALPQCKVLLVPRHPERFGAVAELLASRSDKIRLIDKMGLLNQCYQIATVAIVGGSFVPHVGGHNILEPVFAGVPVLFGPHMQAQLDMVDLVLRAGAGRQVTLAELGPTLLQWFSHKSEYQKYAQACLELAQRIPGSSQRTYRALQQFLIGNCGAFLNKA